MSQLLKVGNPVSTVAELRRGIMDGYDVSFGTVLIPNELARKMPIAVICVWFDLTHDSDYELNPVVWNNGANQK